MQRLVRRLLEVFLEVLECSWVQLGSSVLAWVV